MMENIFSIITPVSVTWSFRNILICWFAAQEAFNIIINIKNSSYFCGIFYVIKKNKKNLY